MAKRISIINFKGGVGKTTLAFHLGTGLARYHDPSRVLLVDMDHQSSLSILCMGSDAWEQAAQQERTVNEVFRPFVDYRRQLPHNEIIFQNPMGNPNYASLDLVPANLDLDNTEIELTASHGGNAILSEWNKRTLLCHWLEETEIDDRYDYIIFDCPPATKIVSQNAIAASHGYIIPVVPEAVMERGAPHLYDMIRTGIDKRLAGFAASDAREEPRAMFVPETRLVGLAITRIQIASGYSGYTNDHTQHLHSLRMRWGDYLLQPYISQGTGVSQALADSVPVYDRDNTQNVGDRGIDTLYKKLIAELKQRIDSL